MGLDTETHDKTLGETWGPHEGGIGTRGVEGTERAQVGLMGAHRDRSGKHRTCMDLHVVPYVCGIVV